MSNLKTVNLGTLAADGSTTAYQLSGSEVSPTSKVNIRSTGTFGGGILIYEGSIDSVSWYGLGAAATLTAPGGAELSMVAGEYIRATISGSAAPSALTEIILVGTN